MKIKKQPPYNRPQILSISFLAIISCLLNFYVGSRGVFPIDTFIHFDQGFRILNGEHPVKDYWIVHGFLIDYLQAIFFWTFGIEWSSYLLHASIFNSIICVSFFVLLNRYLGLTIIESLCFSILIACLSYPISGTPFLDLHSSFFSMLGIFSIILAIIKKKNFYYFVTSILFTAAFFSKQVPAFYIILTSSIFLFYYATTTKNINMLIYYFSGGIFSCLLILFILIINKINFYDFVFQVFIFPKSIGDTRYENYILNFKNIFLDFKFIYLFLFLYIGINLYNKKLKRINFLSDKIRILVLITLFTLSSIFHQVLTKNQIYIFFLIPLLSAFCLYSLNDMKSENVSRFKLVIIIFSIFLTYKYFMRFDIERKFHELNNTKIDNSVGFDTFDKKFKYLNWISPHYKNPQEEIEMLKKMRELLKDNNMLISEYNFFSFTTNKKLNGPSRTYDNISYPLINSQYYDKYRSFLINKIKDNGINVIYILKNKKIDEVKLNHLIFDYIPKNCFNLSFIDSNITQLKVKNCKVLNETK